MDETKGGAMRAIPVLLVLAISGCANQAQMAADRPPNPMVGCVQLVASREDLAPIANKVQLGDVRGQPFALLTLTDSATDGDKPLIAAWVDARQECTRQGQLWLQQYAPPYTALLNYSSSGFLALTADLYAGKITYGDYAKARAKLNADIQREAAAIDQRLREQQAAADEQRKNRAMMYLLNQPAYRPVQPYQVPMPTTTNCYRFGNQVNCTTY